MVVDKFVSKQEYVEFCEQENKNILQPKRSILKYIRTNKGQPRGVLIAYRGEDDKVYIGYSLCNTKSDKFNKQIGIRKAVERAVSDDSFNDEWVDKLPHTVVKPLLDMADRAEAYFK